MGWINNSTDEAVATLNSDVIGNMSIVISCTVYYSTTAGDEYLNVIERTSSLSVGEFSAIAVAENDYAYKGTAGYSVSTVNRGSWVCGTTIEI